MILQNCDIAIIGGGPVGAALALALRDSGLHITLLEARPETSASADPRALALAYGSRLLLDRLGVWHTLQQVTPIKTIHISQQQSFGRSVLSAGEMKVPELGYVLPYVNVQAALLNALKQSAIEMKYGAAVTKLMQDEAGASLTYTLDGSEHQLAAKLVVVADGGKLLEAEHPAEIHDYGQSAIIAHVTCDAPKINTAFERFTPQGPLALLPYRDGYELVWTVPDAQLESMLELGDAALLEQLHRRFGDRVGNFLTIGKRNSFPLRLKRAPATTYSHTVLIGNAAQTLHPVAGQGFNLGLRDAWDLSLLILRSKPESLGDAAMLNEYTQTRNLDRAAGIRFTDSLVRLFSNDLPLLNSGRAASLSLLDCLPGVKKFVARRMMFGING